MLMRFANAFSLAAEKSRNGAGKTSARVKRKDVNRWLVVKKKDESIGGKMSEATLDRQEEIIEWRKKKEYDTRVVSLHRNWSAFAK